MSITSLCALERPNLYPYWILDATEKFDVSTIQRTRPFPYPDKVLRTTSSIAHYPWYRIELVILRMEGAIPRGKSIPPGSRSYIHHKLSATVC